MGPDPPAYSTAGSVPTSYLVPTVVGRNLVNTRRPIHAGAAPSQVRMVAGGASFLPGALLAADLVQLQARLQYLHVPPAAPGAFSRLRDTYRCHLCCARTVFRPV